ncbi:hypothetical protein KI387_002670, partial [Taxus chinensis]
VLGSTTLKAMKMVGESNWVFLGKAVETGVVMKKDMTRCMVKGNCSRYWFVKTVEAQLQKTSDGIYDIMYNLALAGVNYIASQIPQRWIDLLDFEPVAIEEHVAKVKEMLDMEGSWPVDKGKLQILVNRSNSDDEMTVHDILLLMGIKESKGSRITNGVEFSKAMENLSNIKNMKGVSLLDDTLYKVQSIDLNSMHLSQQALILGNWTSRRIEFPAPLITAKMSNCSLMPQRLGHLTALERLDLWGREWEYFLQGLGQLLDLWGREWEYFLQGLGQLLDLEHLNIEYCTNLNFGSEEFGSLHSLNYLSLNMCNLENLPADIVKVTSLKELNISYCSGLVALPKDFGLLSSLQRLNSSHCSNLEKLPANFGMLTALQELDISFNILMELPEGIGGLPSLQKLNLRKCNGVQKLPANFGKWTALQ